MRTRRGLSTPDALPQVGLGEAPSHVRTGSFGSWAAVGCHELRLRPLSVSVSGGTAQASHRALQDPLPADCPGTLPEASGGRSQVAVPSAGSRTTPRSGGTSPAWTQSRDRHLTCPVPQPLHSLRSSLRHLWDVVWKDDTGPRLRTLAPVPARLQLQVTSLRGASAPSLARCQSWVS